MDIVQLKTAEEIRDDILAEISALTGINDANLGSVVRTTSFAVASELDELYFQLWKATKAFYLKTSTGVALDNRGNDFNLTRLPAVKAIGYVTFTGPNPAPGSTTIPQGTLIAVPATATQDEIVYETTTSATITAGNTTVNAPVRAMVAGEDGNVSAATIVYMKQSVSGVTSVTNAAATVLGADEEDDATFRDRILRTIEGLSKGTIPSILHGALDFAVQEATLRGALSAGAVEVPVNEDLTLLPYSVTGTRQIVLGNYAEVITYTGINTASFPHKFTGLTRGAPVAHADGVTVREYVPSGNGQAVTSASLIEGTGHVDVYIDDSSLYGACAELVDLVEKRLRGDGTDRDPGYKGAGITLDVTACSLVLISVTVTVTVMTGYNATNVKTAAKAALVSFLNGLKAGVDVLAYQIVETIMATEGIENITALNVDGTVFDGTTAADVAIAGTEVARADMPSGIVVN